MTPQSGRSVRGAFYALALVFVARAVAMALLPLTDPTEGRYAQVAQEMAITGDWVTPRIWMNESHLAFLGKPPLYFWASAGAIRLLGESEFAMRLPSLLACVALLWLLYSVMGRYGGSGSGLLSVMVTVSCGFFVALSGIVAVDMVFSACVAGSLLAYFAFISESDRAIRQRWSLCVFFFLALGFLTKGPVAIVLFGLPVLIWTVRWRGWTMLRDHRWVAGTLLFLAMVVPWFALCEMRNPGFLKYFFLNENLLRFVTHDYGDAYGSGHLYPHGTALLMLAAAAAPWSLVGLWRVVRHWTEVRVECLKDRQAGFLVLGFAAGTLFWCLARQLLFTYVLPMVPLFAAWLVLTTRGEAIRKRLLVAATALVVVMAAVSFACVPLMQNTKTTRQIVREARRHATVGEKQQQEPLLFVYKTPYSALFYARAWVTPHPKETLVKSLARFRGEGHSALAVVRDVHAKEFQSLPSGSWKRLASEGEWTLIRVATPAPEI